MQATTVLTFHKQDGSPILETDLENILAIATTFNGTVQRQDGLSASIIIDEPNQLTVNMVVRTLETRGYEIVSL